MVEEQNIFSPQHVPSFHPQKKSAPPPQGPSPDEINDINVRIRLLEERFGNLHRKILLTDQNMLTNHKKIFSEIKYINSEVTDIKSKMSEIVDKFQLLIKELQTFAKKSELETIKKYLALWEPTNFVTADQVEKIIQESRSNDPDKVN